MAQQTDHISDGNKMVTAVDWLMWWMGKNQYFIGNDLLQAVKHAKAMEKLQIIKAAADHCYPTCESARTHAEQYYNETYGQAD